MQWNFAQPNLLIEPKTSDLGGQFFRKVKRFLKNRQKIENLTSLRFLTVYGEELGVNDFAGELPATLSVH